MLNDLVTDTLKNEIDQYDKVLVQFSAGWCGNCRIMKPKFKKIANDNSSKNFRDHSIVVVWDAEGDNLSMEFEEEGQEI